MIRDLSQFKEIWFLDFEYQQKGSELPTPVCLVATELYTNQTIQIWKDDFHRHQKCPFELGPQSLYVTYFASAELWCHFALNWKLPIQLIDIHVEFYHLRNGLMKGEKPSLLNALKHFSIPSIDEAKKLEMRNLILTRESWSEDEREDILAYCESDVVALKSLFLAMLPTLEIPRALFRGRYILANAKMEINGIPLDTEFLKTINQNKTEILERLIKNFDPSEEFFEGFVFKESKFANWIERNKLSWPTTPSGKLKLDKETFKEQSLRHPKIEELKEIRKTLIQLRDSKISHDLDGRSRTFYAPFSSLTSRNQPSNSKFIFGLAKWFRYLIKPKKGIAIAYLDWSQQEFGIAAALSKDAAMMAAYNSGDPYMAFAIQAKAAPVGANKETHGMIRAKFKQCILAVQYGMGREALARKLDIKFIEATELLRLHKKVYRQFWEWTQSAVDHAMATNKMRTVFGWTWHITPETKPTTLRNFHMQSNGAEMLRLACIFAIEDGVKVCAPVHDAILIEAPLEGIEEAVLRMQAAMRKASRIVLSGFELNSEAKIVCFPDRYEEKDSQEIWDEIGIFLEQIETTTCIKNAQVMHHSGATALSHKDSSQGDIL